ncbi:MAG: thioredoxin [Catenulispora sp.]|nr:thioredoxin [Catenulispora sp.]
MTALVTDATFADEVLASEVPVLVDFWADWCPPCHRIAPVLDELDAEYAGRARIVKINADENPAATRAYGVQSMPTLLMFRGGEVISTMIGAHPKPRLRAQLDNAIEG